MHFLKSYSKFTIILKVNKLLPKETKHKIKGLFVLNKHLFDVIKIKKSNKLNIKYFNDKNKPIKIFDDKLKECLLYLNNKFKININYEIVITKYIPLRSGLGGSATNAGTLIKYLCSKNKINLKSLDLKYIALNFGSDIPFFLFEHQNAIVSNYGDKVKKIKLNDINYKLFLSKYSFTSQQIFKLLDSNKKYKSRVNFN
jgi:4-diphosphocytidyl-2C-methyl-D-erythritol kinase